METRICDCCGAEMDEGYVLVDEYACSNECADTLAKKSGYDSYLAMHDEFAEEDEDGEIESGEVYWTQWNE
jgi:hypothetical protein